MKQMKAIINGRIILKDEIIDNKVLLFDKTIIGILEDIPLEYADDLHVIDAKGRYVSPGLIDIHTHGCIGHDFMYADMWEIQDMELSMASTGVTGYLATTMTMNTEIIISTLERLNRKLKTKIRTKGSKMLGIHLEGPFLNPKFSGAQDPNFIIPPNIELVLPYKDIIKIITYSPEQDTDFIFTKYISDNTDIILSMGHSNATYDEACKAIENGAKNTTHLFNAMTGFNHRDPGVVGASIFNDVKCELIADKVHVNKDIFQFLIKSKRFEDIILVSDSMEATGLSDGVYSIGGHPVDVKGGCARLQSNGALAGSTLRLNDAVNNFYECTSLNLPEAIRLASLNPAIALGIDKFKGSILEGKDADLVIFDENLNCYTTVVEGSIVYEKTLTISEVKSKLKSIPNKEVRSMDGYAISPTFGSYRGNYSDLYIEVDYSKVDTINRDDLISLLDDALSHEFMHGYRGGNCEITNDTKVVLSEYGVSTGYYIQDIFDRGEYIEINHLIKR